MPVSHIGLTVSHLPTSCSFFLAALQPLGYRFLGQWGNQIGLGVNEADFFLTQETPGIKAGAAHVAFSASSRIAVREFYANALQAGGRPHGSPASRSEDDCFNAAVLDLDGNSVEVVFHENAAAVNDAASAAGKSRLLTWRNDVSKNLSDNKSAAGSLASAATSLAKKTMVPATSVAARSVKAPSVAPSVAQSAAPSSASKTSAKPRSEASTVQRSFTAPHLTPQSSNDNISISRKTLVGTILGAAAGAAVAYAMCKSEQDSSKAEQAAYLAAQGATKRLQESHPHLLEAKPTYSSPTTRSARNASEIEYESGHHPVRAIEAPPSNYHHPSYTTVITGQQPMAETVVTKTRAPSIRSASYPESAARSSIISSFVPDEQPREMPSFTDIEYRSPAPSHVPSQASKSHHSTSSSKAKSSASKHTSASASASNTGSKRSSHHAHSSTSTSKREARSRSRSRSKSRTPHRTPQPSLSRILESTSTTSPTSRSRASHASAAQSKGTSVLGRSVVPSQQDHPPSSSSEDNAEDTDPTSDLDTIVPSDSVSQIGSSPSTHHSRRSHRHGTSASASASASAVSARRTSEVDMLAVEPKKKHKKKSRRSGSEAASESTVTPEKYAGAGYQHRWEERVPASVTSLPVRGGVVPVQAGSGFAGHGRGRSVVSYYG